jgi:hypothetical protein
MRLKPCGFGVARRQSSWRLNSVTCGGRVAVHFGISSAAVLANVILHR